MFQSVQGDLKDLDDRDRVCLGGWDLSWWRYALYVLDNTFQFSLHCFDSVSSDDD